MKPPQSTRVPLVVDGLIAMFKTIADVTVMDGPSPITPQDDCIEVGVGDEGVMVTEDAQPGLRTAYTENIYVVCSLWSWSGSPEMKPRRDRCHELLEQIDLKLREDPHLGGACDRVLFGPDQSWVQQLTEEGAAVSVGFVINARSNI